MDSDEYKSYKALKVNWIYAFRFGIRIEMERL